MRRNTGLLIAFFMIAAPAALSAQTRPARPGQPEAPALHERPVPGVEHADHILAYREELGLTTQQVTRIRGLRTQLIEQNRPLVDRLAQSAQQHVRPEQRVQQLQQQQQRGRVQQQLRQLQQRAQQQRQRTGQLSGEQRQQMQMQQRQDSMRTRMQALTEEQRQAARELARQRTQAPGRAGAGMSGQVADEATRARLEEMRTNTRQIVEQINDVLTPEQHAKLRELRPGRIGR